jgi:gluconolactonase
MRAVRPQPGKARFTTVALVTALAAGCAADAAAPSSEEPAGAGGAAAGGAGLGGKGFGGAGGGGNPGPDGSVAPDGSISEPSRDGPGDDAATDAGGAPGQGGLSGQGGESGSAGSSLAPPGSVCTPGATYGNPLPANARATTIRMGFREAEGPVWVPALDVLFVSDIDENDLGNGAIYRYTPATKQWDAVASKVGSNGLALDVDGRIVAACHDLPGIYRFDPLTAMRTKIPGADMFEGKPFNEPNDVVVRGDGNIYFTDPKLQPGGKGRAGQGVTAYYRLSPAGVMTRIAVSPQPNGIALSPDGHFLYVAGGAPMRRHAVAADGSVAPDFTVLAQTSSDGMGIDCAGNIYVTTGNGVTVLSSDGQKLGTIAVPSSGFMTNVAFGGADRKTLYITTRYGVHELQVNVPGFPN